MKKNKRNILIIKLSIVLLIVCLMVTGGTYAYWTWTSETDKNVVFTTASIEGKVIYNEGDSYFVGDFQPTSTFCQNINTTFSFYKTSDAADMDLSATIYMDVNSIGTNIAASSDVYWVITSGSSSISCSSGLSSSSVIASGTFKGKSAGDVITLASNVEVTTTEQFFTVWIWLDSSGSNLTVLSGETVDTNIWTQIDLLSNE